MKKQVVWSNQFKKDYKLCIKRGLPIEELDAVIKLLAGNNPLPPKYKDHELSGFGRDLENVISSLIGY